ncbi:hypothetical protein BX600DRAFT_17218 [Xylariales sp. PMI_506]|nr:hypothetical protein BX600DRAFT_17218 [Xylariales sp. PMI_506]
MMNGIGMRWHVKTVSERTRRMPRKRVSSVPVPVPIPVPVRAPVLVLLQVIIHHAHEEVAGFHFGQPHLASSLIPSPASPLCWTPATPLPLTNPCANPTLFAPGDVLSCRAGASFISLRGVFWSRMQQNSRPSPAVRDGDHGISSLSTYPFP